MTTDHSHTTILVHTSAAAAVRAGCQHGWARVDIDTRSLAADERELLAASVVEREGARYGRLDTGYQTPRGGEVVPYDVAPPTVVGLRESLRARIDDTEQAASREAEERAERERHGAEYRAQIAARDALADAELDDVVASLRNAPHTDLIIDGDQLRPVPANLMNAARRRPGVAWWGPGGHDLCLADLVGRREEVKAVITAQFERDQEAARITEAGHRAARVNWLRKRGLTEPAAREEAGVLPLIEMREAMEEAILAVLGDAWETPPPSSTEDVPSTWTASQWATICTYRDATALPVPDGMEGGQWSVEIETTTWIHSPEDADADDDGDVKVYPYLLATFEWAGLEFEFARFLLR